MWIRLYRSDRRHELTTTIVDLNIDHDATANPVSIQVKSSETHEYETIPLDPFLYEFLVNAVEYVNELDDERSSVGEWKFEPVLDVMETAGLVRVQVIHRARDTAKFDATLWNERVVESNSIFHVGELIVLVHEVQGLANNTMNGSPCYKVRNGITTILQEDHTSTAPDCPGYESFLQQLIKLLEMPVAIRPSGIFVHGCSGVGKSAIIEYLIRRHPGIQYHRVPRNLFRFSSSKAAVCLVDDLDLILADNEQNESHLEIAMNQGIMVVAFGAELPPASFLSAGRLEMVLELLPPSQLQRETMLSSMLPNALPSWIPNLAQLTAGCVAADLIRLKLVVGEDYQSYAETAYSLVPSQMATLDVQKPAFLTEHSQVMTEKGLFIHSFRDFVGYEETKRRLFRAVVLPWTRHLKGSTSGIVDPPAGVLFHGPSGCGKTIAAKCLGSALGLSMIQVRATDVLDQFVGGSEAVVRAMFSRARQAAPCILFLDEIDSLASNREENSTGVMSRVLSTMLNEMDGISSGAGGQHVLIVACTNRLDAIDSAMLRPGRLEIHIPLQLPPCNDIKAILRAKLKSVDLKENLQTIVARLASAGVTGADVYGVCREAVFQSLRRSKEKPVRITIEDFESVLVRMGIGL